MSYVPSNLRKKIDWLFRRAESALLQEIGRLHVDNLDGVASSDDAVLRCIAS